MFAKTVPGPGLKGKGGLGAAPLDKPYYAGDLESGPDALYPGISVSEQGLRWGFIQKVYGILCCMLLCTTAVCSVMMFDQSVQAFVYANPWVQVLSMVCPLVGLIPLYCYRHSHPLNLALLGIWTATLSIGVGMVCAAYPTQVVLEALVLTAAVTLGLTGYTFYATAAGKEFDFMAPFLCASLFGLLAVSVIAMFFPVSSGFQLFLAFAGAVLFAAYIVWDTFALIKRFSVDEYVWASVSLFLDIINLFLRLVEILGAGRAE